jgi:hypothetical protein
VRYQPCRVAIPIRHQSILSGNAQRRHVASLFLQRRTKRRPLQHKPTPLFEKVATSIGLLDLITYDVGKSRFDNLILK